MSQADLNVANQSGAAFRADLNTQLLALGTLQSGASEPGTTYAYMLWADSANGLLKQRNAANNGWVSLGSLVTTNLGMLPIAGGTMTGALGVTAGTVSAPGVFFSGDTNTGLYSPGADQVAISTGGSGRLFVDASGRVGVGTAPNKTIDAYVTGTTQATLRLSDVDSRNVELRSPNSLGELAGVGTVTNHDFIGFTGNTERARIRSDGTFEIKGAGTAGVSPGFSVNPSTPANSFVIDSSGRLLVGTSSARSNINNVWGASTPRTQIENNVSDGNLGLSLINNSTSGYSPVITLGLSLGSSIGSNTLVSSSLALGAINFTGSDGTNFIQAASISALVDGTPGANDMPGRLVFSTTADGASSPTERMRITSGGAFKASSNGSYSSVNGPYHEFYQTTNTVGLFIRCTNGSYTSTILEINGDRVTTNASYNLIDAYNGAITGRFSVRDSGNAVNTNNSYGAISDVKLKENIVDAGSQWADIKAFRVRKYNLKEGQKHTQIGGIAQEVELVSPGLVTESPDRDAEGNDLGTVTKSINYSVLYMKAVKALQEAMERIEALEADVAQLKGA